MDILYAFFDGGIMKRIIYLLIALLLAVSVVTVCSVAADETDSPKHIPRVVSIVFDDSGSMFRDNDAADSGTDRWAYASYAMQTFVAMMDPTDVLYVTYINANGGTPQLIKLSNVDDRKAEIEKIRTMTFGGTTPNKLDTAAERLVYEYGKRKNDAIYYYVVMADGVLNRNDGDFASDLPKTVDSLKASLDGAELGAIFFEMGESINVGSKVRKKEAATGKKIVTALNEVSTEIMGRTDITKSCEVTDGQLSFRLDYPAYSVTVFAQKTDGTFENVTLEMKKGDSAAGYHVDTYPVSCPEKFADSYVNDGTAFTVRDPDAKDGYKSTVHPKNPPKGFVSTFTNANGVISKGSYTVDLSKYGLEKKDLFVLVEPAVRVGCIYGFGEKYYDSFDEVKGMLRAGDNVSVTCGLYEINEDGTLGEAVSSDLLPSEFKLFVNGEPQTRTKDGQPNTFIFEVKEEYANKELKVEAELNGYLPLVKRETFGDISLKVNIPAIPDNFDNSLTVTKKNWKDWTDGKIKLEFPAENVDAGSLSRLRITVDGYDGIKSGACDKLNVSIKGNAVVLVPEVKGGETFESLPKGFNITLHTDSGDTLSFKATVIQPKYKLDVENELEGKVLSIDLLTDNDKSVVFTLTADYDGKGYEEPIEDITFELDSGKLTGNTEEDGASLSFTPEFDADKNSPADILGSDHKLSVKAFVDGEEVADSTVSFSVSNATYKLTVDNPISTVFTLDSIKTNEQRIVFTVLADYTGDGGFGSLADWDSTVYERVTVTSGKLPGKFETLYDAGGKPVGKAFIPLYDENNNNGVVFTEVAGRVHTVKATLDSLEAETTVEVSAPVYEVEVRRENFTLIDVDFGSNEQGVEFTVKRDARVLSEEELEGLAPYELTIDKKHKRITLTPNPETDADGEAYLSVVPTYDGWQFIPEALRVAVYSWRVKGGDMLITYTLNENDYTATVNIEKDPYARILLWIILAIIVTVIWLIVCKIFRVRFLNGKFHTMTYSRSSEGWTCSGVNSSKPSRTRGVFPAQIVPFGCVRKNVSGIKFRTFRDDGLKSVYPEYTVKDNTSLINLNAAPCTVKIDAQLTLLKVADNGGYEKRADGGDMQVVYTEEELCGSDITNKQTMRRGVVIFKKMDENTIIAITFVPKRK